MPFLFRTPMRRLPPRWIRSTVAALCALCAVSALPASAASAESGDLWQQRVRPLLARSCYACHGPDENKREAELRLDRPSTWGPGLAVAGQPADSLLWQRVSSEGEDRMPPAPEHDPLTADELRLIRDWLQRGAVAESHWSHRPIERPALPEIASPWVRNEIDLLLQEQHQRAGHTPQLASRDALQRRLALTLTGLPFVGTTGDYQPRMADRSDRSIARYIDELIASAHFGEHSGVSWLDVARYADTHGYHIDGHRDMWRWRDWVIEAHNQNLPFDRFTIHQLAGDLLPPAESRFATMRQRLATGFLRNTPINSEDGAIAEEFLAEYAAERTIAVGTAWLGQTMQCCRCHDHKNDPTLQQEFYQLAAFFNDLPEKGVDGRHGNAAPTMAAPTWNEELRWRQAAAERLSLEREQRRALQSVQGSRRQRRWEQQALEAGARPGPDDFVARLPFKESEGRKLAADPGPAARLMGRVTRLPSLRRDGNFSLAMTGRQRILWQAPPEPSFTLAAWMFLTTNDPMTLVALGNPALALRIDRDGLKLLERGEVLAQTRPRVAWPKRQWRLLAWSFENGAHRISLNGELLMKHVEPMRPEARTGDQRHRFETGLHISLGGPEPSGTDETAAAGLRGILDEAYLFARSLSAEELQRLAADDPLVRVLAKSADDRSEEERRLVREAWLLAEDSAFAARHRRLLQLAKSMERMKAAFPRSMVMAVGPQRPTRVLVRGDYQRPGERVQRGVPHWLPPCEPAGEQPTRLDLARWLTSDNHPLTARVAANRIWKQHFGVALAPTPDDLGLGGEAPQHPELLDLLASELIRSGWDQKHLHRLIVSSMAYLQQRPQEGALPHARLLTAEQLRDSALAVSGLLSTRVGGPSVFPYQPDGLWEELARDPNLYSAQVYREDDGEGLYRRSLYTFWKRSSPPATLALLGAPSRETCEASRAAATGPQRSLVMLNDPIFIESARHVAAGLLEQPSMDARIAAGLRQVLRREPTDRERQTLRSVAEQLLAHYRDRTAAARRLIGVGRSVADDSSPEALAAWTAWVHLLMNTREFETCP